MDVKRSSKRKVLMGAQIRAARALIGWSASELAEKAQIGISTLRRAENGDGALTITIANQAAILRALEDAGVTLLDQGARGPGVRLAKPLQEA